MDKAKDLGRVALQERRLRFASFDHATAWAIGSRLRQLAHERGLSVAIEVRLHHQPLFFAALPGTTADNADWLRRKHNAVVRFERSSYALGLDIGEERLEQTWGLGRRDYALHGGCFPVFVGETCVGTVGVSGLPQREDHKLVVEVLAEHLGVGLEEVGLD
ncbi:MAG: heme-degrading domain-containing protein [Meiothermus sp.]|nr:heme-degrading domain-containing protein [Meiothermus sp.]